MISVLAEFDLFELIGLNKVTHMLIHLFHFVSSLNWFLADHFMMGYICVESLFWFDFLVDDD